MDLSIIIPLYNCENHIHRTFGILKNQGVFESLSSSVEVILINDGSTDSTLNIAKEYEKLYFNLRLISKENEGQHIARNTGIDIAKGDYIYLIDDDDVIRAEAIRTLLEFALTNKPDILVFGWQQVLVSETNNLINKNTPIAKPTITYAGSGEGFIGISNGMISQDAIWNKFFNRNFIEQNKLRFSDTVVFGEDSAFVWSAFTRANKVIAIDTLAYYWVNHPTNCSNTLSSGAKWKLSQENIAIFLNGLIADNPSFSYSLKKDIKRKQDSYTFAYWAYILRTGVDIDNYFNHISQHKKLCIYPISKEFPTQYYPNGMDGLKFRFLWYIISNEKLLVFLLKGKRFLKRFNFI